MHPVWILDQLCMKTKNAWWDFFLAPSKRTNDFTAALHPGSGAMKSHLCFHIFLGHCPFFSFPFTGEQGWRSGESTRLPPMWPRFDSQTRRHKWVEFVLVLFSASRVFLRVLQFSPLSKNQHTADSSLAVSCAPRSHMDPQSPDLSRSSDRYPKTHAVAVAAALSHACWMILLPCSIASSLFGVRWSRVGFLGFAGGE